MKKYLISGFNTVQDVKLEAGTYTLVAYVKSMHGDVYTFALGDGTDWDEFSIDVIQGQLCKVWLTFAIDKKATKFKPIANNFSESLPVYVADLQLTRGNIPVESGASPFDIDQILNDLHDEIDAIEDFAEGAFLDGLLSREEKTQLRASLDSIGAIVESVKGSYDKLKVNPFISQDRMADINRTYNDFMVAWVNIYFDPENPIVEDGEGNRINIGGLKDIILWIIEGDHIVDENERAEKDRALEAFNSALYAYNLAEKEVYKDIGYEVEELEDYMEGAFQDGILDEGEKQKIRAYLQSIEETMGRAESQFTKVFGNTLLKGTAKSNLENAKINLWGRRENLVNAINTALDSTKLTQAQIDNVNKHLNGWSGNPSFNAIMKSFQDAIEEARKSIDEQRIKNTIVKVDVEYALGDSMTKAPTTGWKTIADPWQKNKYMWSRIATYYKGNPETPVYSDETCIAGARGIGVESITERYYHSTSDTELLGGEWSDDAPTPLPNRYIWTRSIIKYTDASVPDKYTDPIMASGFSGKTISISASATSFRTSKEGIETPSEIIVKAFASNTTITSWLYSVNGGEFKTTNKPHEVTGSGNARTIPKSTEFDTLSIMVTDGTLEDVITINRVSDAIKVTETIDYYGISASETVEPQTWHKNTIPTKTPEQYLWNYERIEYSNGDWYETEKHVIQGKDPRSIESIKNQYIYSTSDTEPPSDTANWKDTVQLLGARPANRFLWIRDYIVYSYGDDSVTEGRLVKEGNDGEKGEDGYSVTLSKSEHTFNYDKNGNLKGLLSHGVVTVEVMKGSNALICDNSGMLSPTVDNTYRVTSITQSPTSSFIYNVDRQNNIFRIIPTQINADEVMVTFTIVARTNGINATFNRKLKYQKSYDGTDGDDGLPPEIDTTITQYALGESKTEHPAEEGQVWAPSRIIDGQTFPAGYIDIWQDDRKHLVPNEATPYEWSRQKITYKNSTQVIYVGYVLITNISPMTYFFGEWDLRVTYTRNDKSYPIVTYKKGTNNRPLYYYPKKEGVIEYIWFVKPNVNSPSTWYKQNDLVLYENDGSNGDPVCPLGIFKSKYNDNKYLPSVSTWWENATAKYAPNGIEGQKLWEFADGVELIITEALMANFAKLDSFVFNDGKMFSQEGTLNGVAGSVDYTNKDHVPNFEVEGVSGKVKMKDAEIEGRVTATSGSFKGHIEANSGTIENVTISNANINAISVDGLLKVSTGFEGSLTNNNLFWIAPSVSNASAYTPSVDFDSKGKIIKLYNSSFTKTHVIALRYAGFVLVNGVLQLTDFTLDDPDKGVIKENIELPPRANIEISCFELPPGTYKSGGSSARYYHRVLGWVMTDRSLFERIDYKTIGSDTFAIPSNTNYTLRQSSPLSILTSVGTNSTLIRIYMDNTNQVRDGTIKWILNSTPTTVDYGLTGNIRNHSEGFEKLQAWSITPFIHYGGYWYKHSDRK